jgi:hypothetical protein NreA
VAGIDLRTGHRTQLQAVEKAIGSAKKTLVHDHIDHCLEHTIRKGSRGANSSIREFKGNHQVL